MRKNALLKKLERSAIVGADRYFTKPKLALRIVEWALRYNHAGDELRFLEPNAGGGAFVDAILEVTSVQGIKAHVTAVEIDTVLAARLERKYAGEPRVKVICHDFLQFKVRPGTENDPPFDLSIMNPPYGSRERGTVGEDAVHVRHALRFARKVVGLLVTGFEHGKGRARELFDVGRVEQRVVLVRRPGFDGPEDKGESARRDHVVLKIQDKPAHCEQNMVLTERWELDKKGEPILINERSEE